MSCENLIEAIDRYIAKADEDMTSQLESEGFIDTKRTVKEASKLEEKIAAALKNENDKILEEMSKAKNLDELIETVWPVIQANDNVDLLLSEVFREAFTSNVTRLANAYIKQIDSELTVKQITKRLADWVINWSDELGQLMKLTTHEEIERLLLKHLAAGDSVQDLTLALQGSNIRDEYYRARRVALTEMLRAHSVAQEQSILQNPAVSQKEWRHTGSYRNTPRENHVAMDGEIVDKSEPFELLGADGNLYYPMYPRDTNLPPGESVNCHCIHRGIADDDVLGLTLEERKRLQQKAIDEDDGEWLKELDAEYKLKAGITV